MDNIEEKITIWIKNPETITQKDSEEIPALIRKYPYFEPLHLLYIKTNIDKPEINEIVKRHGIYISNRKKSYQFIYDKPEIPEKISFYYTDTLGKDHKAYRINEYFPEENPELPICELIKRIRGNETSQEVDENKNTEGIFTETLARIYIKQGLYEKALATYFKLMLKFPEKSYYFADQIEFLKNKINNNS